MKVFKFGGASVKDVDSVRNVVDILKMFPNEKILVVVSAMAKTTNSLEQVVDSVFYKKENTLELVKEIENFHYKIISQLFDNEAPKCREEVDNLFIQMKEKLKIDNFGDYDYFYDQIVGFGELISTCIVENYLHFTGLMSRWEDVRSYIRTDGIFRDASVDWQKSEMNIQNVLLPLFENYNIIVTQGFIGETEHGMTSTLGREGSDFTGSIFSYCLNASDFTIWKDVPGLLNADPKLMEKTYKLDSISYSEAIELSYYGASIIHPKTIKPLQNKKIPLYVKSFVHPELQGSVIQDDKSNDGLIESYIFKPNQVLISISSRDFSFIAEQNLSIIFSKLAENKLKVNLMQNSAISFSICVEQNEEKIAQFILDIQNDFMVKYNEGLELITIRHYNEQILNSMTLGKKILLEQKSRITAQLLVKK